MNGSRRIWLLLALAALAVPLAVAVLGGCSRASDGTSHQVSGQPSADTDLRAAGARAIPVDGDWLAAGAGAVWLSGRGVIHRLAARSGRPVRTIRVPQGPCQASDLGFGALWTATCGTPGLARIDPATNRVTGHLPLRVPEKLHGEGSIGVGVGGVWLVVNGPRCKARRLARVEPGSLRLVSRIPITPGSAAVRVGYGAVWVTDPENNLVHKIDPLRNRIARSTAVAGSPRFLAVGERAVWTLNQFDGTITRLHPRTGRAKATIPADVVGEGGDVTVGGGWVWARGTDRLLTRIDPRTNRVAERYGPPSGSGAVTVGFGAVWLSAHDIDTVWRLPVPDR